MRDQEIEFNFQLEEKFWWFRGMRDITWSWIADLKPQTILDAGCGTGFNLGWLQEHFQSAEVVGTDLASRALELALARDRRARLVQGSVTELPFADGSFDLITSFDTLSQMPLSSVSLALGEFHRVIQPTGHLYIRDAAFPWLYSSHDVELETLIRFTLPMLVELLRGAGFQVAQKSYANFFLFPVALIRRHLKRLGLFAGSDVRPLTGGMALLEPGFLAVLRQEARLMRGRVRFPFGLSVVALAHKAGIQE